MNRPAELRRIPGHPRYYAGSCGGVWTWTGPTLRPLVATEGRDGYLAVCLYFGRGRRVRKRVHRLVCAAFHGERLTAVDGRRKWVVRHLDGDRQNNRPDNLAWGTYAQNYADYRAHQQEWADAERRGPPPAWGGGDAVPL